MNRQQQYRIGLCLLLIVLSVAHGAIAAPAYAAATAQERAGTGASAGGDSGAARRGVGFEHLTTGFPLVGAHARLTCETCHARGIFKGTPTQCATCHVKGSHIASSAKPANHIPTVAACDQCHAAVTWTVARFDHSTVVPGSCSTCHNGAMVAGKPANHVRTTASCDTCHTTRMWVPASFSHANVAPGTCATCHNGSTATGKPGNHLATTASCDTCHATRAWVPATFNHASVVPGTCATCHNGATATGKSSGHFITTRSCDACHSSTRWQPATAYVHTSPFYKKHSGTLTCNTCHTNNNEVLAWPAPQYKPDCAGCHASKFVPDSHIKTGSPTTVRYTVSELRDCAGSCHIYTNNTFTTIQTTRTGKHSPARGW